MTATTADRGRRAVASLRRGHAQPVSALPERSRVGRVITGTRARILVWFVALMSLAVLGAVLVGREVLLARMLERVDAELNQERDEVEQLIYPVDPVTGERGVGVDPATGAPFRGNVKAIFDVFLSRSVPSMNEVVITFLDGQPYLRSATVDPAFRLDLEPRILALGDVHQPVRDTIATQAGPVRYLAVPVGGPEGAGRPAPGVIVIAEFLQPLLDELTAGVRVGAAVALGLLLIASVLAWAAAGRILAPVRLVTDTARRISESDLSGRIPAEGRDEFSALAATFNDMLDRLETSFETQRNFVDDAGHELRTPITIIRGHLELLGDDPEERLETVAIVTDELDRMNRMVDDLLVLAKAGRPDFLERASLDVEALTVDLHAKAGALASRRWVLEQTGHGNVFADRQRLTQAVIQIAQNATQHTAEGDVIALGSALADGEARFWVRDTGPGVAEEDRERIFERFARAAASRRRSEGAGLGLPIVRAIAEAHGGRVELRSRPGAGTMFTVVVPVSPSRDWQEPPLPGSSQAEGRA